MIKDLFGDNYISKNDIIECFQEVLDEYESFKIETYYRCLFPKKSRLYTLCNNLELHPSDIKSISSNKDPFLVSYYKVTLSYNMLKELTSHTEYKNDPTSICINRLKKEMIKDIDDKIKFCSVRLFNVQIQNTLNDYSYIVNIISDVNSIPSTLWSKYSNLIIEK